MPGQTFYKDKPYAFVPLVDKMKKVAPDSCRNKIAGECGTLEITITTKTPVHFGQGELTVNLRDTKKPFTHSLHRCDGKIVLPGSSFKGMLRSVFEAVSESCVLFAPRDSYTRWALPQENRYACKPSEGVCPACSVFGCLGQKGKLSFTDFVAYEDAKTKPYVIPQLQTPFRDYPVKNSRHAVYRGWGNERLYYGDFEDIHGTEIGNLTKEDFFARKDKKQNKRIRFYGRKIYKHAGNVIEGNDFYGNTYECLRENTKISGKICYQGLTQAELAVLAFALGMGWDQKIFHKIGYAKPAYFGSISIDVLAAAPSGRYKGLGVYRSTENIEALAREYRQNAVDDVQEAIQTIQRQWCCVDKRPSWKETDGQKNGSKSLIY